MYTPIYYLLNSSCYKLHLSRSCFLHLHLWLVERNTMILINEPQIATELMLGVRVICMQQEQLDWLCWIGLLVDESAVRARSSAGVSCVVNVDNNLAAADRPNLCWKVKLSRGEQHRSKTNGFGAQIAAGVREANVRSIITVLWRLNCKQHLEYVVDRLQRWATTKVESFCHCKNSWLKRFKFKNFCKKKRYANCIGSFYWGTDATGSIKINFPPILWPRYPVAWIQRPRYTRC